MYVLSLLEKEDERREALLERFTEIVVNSSDHYQPGYRYIGRFHKCTPCITEFLLRGPNFANDLKNLYH